MKKNVIFFVFVAYLLSSCSNNEYYNDETTGSDVALSVANVSIGAEKLNKNIVTRASLTGDIGISRIATGVYTAQSNIKYTYAANAWSPAVSTSQIFVANSDATLCAYSPYSSTYTGVVNMTSGVYSNANDFCYGYATGINSGNAGNGVNFTLNHAYSKLILRFSKDAFFTGTGNITSITISGAANTGTLTLNGTSPSMGSLTSSPVSITGSPVTTLPGVVGNTVDVTLLMVPTTLFDDLSITIVVDGATKTATLSKTSLISLAAGYSYTIPVTVTKYILDIPNSGNVITAQDWNTTSGPDIFLYNDTLRISQPESNCYMVTPGSSFYIPVSRAVAGNAAIGYVATGGGYPAFTSGDIFSTGVLWSDAPITDRTATVADQHIKINAGATEGNFVVYAKKGTSIVWSWHIWVSNYIPSSTAKPGIPTVTSGTGSIPYHDSQYWMDRNLGATTSGGNNQKSMGLYYQWGRKDPFPGASGLTSTTGKTIYLPQNITYPAGMTAISGYNSNVRYIGTSTTVTTANQSSYAIQYPLLFLTDWAGSTASAAANGTTNAGGIYSWCTSDNNKSLFDPCPVGWRTSISTSYATCPWKYLGSSGTAYTGASWYGPYYGILVKNASNVEIAFYPAAGVMNIGTNGSIFQPGIIGDYWSGSIYNNQGSRMYFYNSYIKVYDTAYRSYGFSVRCVQE